MFENTEESEIRKRKDNTINILSRPIKPSDIPVKHKKVIQNNLKSNIDEYKSAIDIKPEEGIFYYINIPAIIFLGVLGGYIIGRFRFNIIYILFIGYTIYFVYNRRVNKFTRSLKSLIYNNTRNEQSKYVGESVEWINYIVNKFWKVAEPVVASDIYQNVNRELLKVRPPFLNDLKLAEFTLGSRPPVIEQITYHSSKDNSVTLDLSVAFVPLEASKDAISYYLGEDKQWNSKIILKARLGTRNNIGINLPILVKDLCFKGRLRAKLNLIPKNNFIKDVEICLLEIPDFDFTLVPLKTLDLMDIPGLSTWIRKSINTVMSKVLINPNSITVDIDKIAKSIGHDTGVACIQILTLENEEDERLVGEIDLDGIPLFQTTSKTGRNLVFNEYFYSIIQNVDEKFNISFYGDSKSIGSLFLRNVHSNLDETVNTIVKMDKSIITTQPKDKIFIRRTAFDKIRLIKNEQTYAYLNVNLVFYPITNKLKKTNSAIVTLKLIGAENVVSLNTEKREAFSSFCIIIVSPLHKDYNTIPHEYVKNTSGVAALIVSEVLKVEDDEFQNISIGNASVSDLLLPPSSSTFYIFESKRVFNNTSPNFNETFKLFSRDLSVDVVSICIINEKSSEILGRVGLKLNDVVEGKPMRYKLKDARTGNLEVQLDFQYIDLQQENQEIIKYTAIQKVTVETVSEEGVFYGVIETNSDIFNMNPFTTNLPIKKSVFVPIYETDTLKFKLYKETIHGDVFLGEEILNINFTEEPKKTTCIFEKVSILLKVEGEYLSDYKLNTTKKDTLKIIQIKIGKFYNLNEEVFIEFRDSNGILKTSPFSRDKQINNVFTLLVGKEEVFGLVKNADQGENRILGRFVVPMRYANEQISLNEFGLSMDITCYVQTCNYTAPSNLQKGFLEVYIKSAKDLKFGERGKVNAYVKILVNDNKVYKTKTAKEDINPTFYESFIMPIDKIRDVFTIQVYDQYSSSKNALLSFVEFPLHNIEEGFSEVEFKMIDSKTFRKSGSKIRIGFNFCKDPNALKIKKRGILGDFFGF